MANMSHPTSPAAKSKPKRTPAMCQKLIVLGVPKDLAPTWPLTPHPTGRWCKKLKTPEGWKVFFFGRLDAWQDARQSYLDQLADILAGRPIRKSADGLRLLDLCNRWLHYKRSLITTGELTMRTWDDYFQTSTRVVQVFGKDRVVEDLGPDDFEKLRADFGKSWGPVKIRNEMTRTKMIFGYAFAQDLIERPIKYGKAFEPPDKEVIRKHRARQRTKHGPRMFEAAELRRILSAADPCMKALVLLAANAGFANMDLAMLPTTAVDLSSAWIDFPRPKTGIDRKVPLWPETVKAIKAWLAVRPEPKREEDGHLLFLTKQRLPWYRLGRFVETDGAVQVKGIDNPLSKAFKWLMNKLGLNSMRGFYSIRHGFETIAGDTGDQVAVDAIMGHSDPSMVAYYRERIDPKRLQRVVQHVRRWLFGK